MMDVVPQLETCRICAKCYLASSPADFLHLFQPTQGKEYELEFIRKEIDCWQLKISPNDGLPQQICSNCFQKFCTIESFRQECMAAQNLLHKAHEMTESQMQNNNATSQSQTAILLPGTIFLTSTQPIAQKLNTAAPQNLNGVLKESNNLVPQEKNNNQTPEDGILFDFVNENSALVNDVTAPIDNQYKTNNETCWDESKLFNEVIAQEADTTTQSSTEDNPKMESNSNDFEEVLEGSIIPKNLKSILNNNAESPALKLVDDQHIDEIVEDNIPLRIANFPHACNYCYCPPSGSIKHLVFDSSEELSQHFFDVHDPKLPYPCPKCPKLFATMANRNKHFRAMHGVASKASRHCSYCNKKLTTSQEMHEKTCNFTADWYCETCKNDFIQMPLHSFRAHQRSHNERHFRCETCNLVFSQLSILLIHKRIHRNTNPRIKKDDLNCMNCNQEFNSLFDLKSHELTAHNLTETFRCKLCAKVYSTEACLKRHIKNVHTNSTKFLNQGKATCFKCNTTFQSKNKLQGTEHVNRRCIPIKVASNLNPHKKSIRSDQCLKYLNSEELKVHPKSHDNQLACKKRSVHCRTTGNLKENENLAHFEVTTFDCDKCNEKFAYAKDLETHKLYHANLKSQCTFKDCKANYSDEKELEKHMRDHEMVSCEYCGKLFTLNDVEAHIKSTHNNNNNNDLGDNNFKNVSAKPINDFSFNQNHIFENFASPLNVIEQTSTLALNQNDENICAPYVEPMETGMMDNNNIFVEQQLLTEENDTIDNNVDFIMSENFGVNDSFISTLLDPDYEIVIT